MDPVLAQRLAKQRAKEDGVLQAGAVSEAMRATPSEEQRMDPKLAARLERQRAKEAGLVESPQLDSIRKSPSPCRRPPSSGLDPVLQRRLAEQREKEGTGATAKDDVHSAAVIRKNFDPTLERRLAEQQRKLETGASAVDEARLERKVAHIAPKDEILQRRMNNQMEKVLTGEAAFAGEIGSAAGAANRVSDELAARLEQRRRKADGTPEVDPAAAAEPESPASTEESGAASASSTESGSEAASGKSAAGHDACARKRTWFQQIGRFLRQTCSRT